MFKKITKLIKNSKTYPWQPPVLIIFIALIIVAGLIYIFNKPKLVEAEWFNDGWMYRQTVGITNAGTAQTDFQVKITLDTATLITNGKLQSDCDDLRITDINGNILPHWIEDDTCNTASTYIWTKAPSIPTSGATLYLYYGNASAENVADGDNVFEFFDDFSGDLAKWVNVTSSGWSVSSGLLNITPAVANNYLVANKSIGASGVVIESKIKSNHTSGNSHPGVIWHANTSTGSAHRNDHIYLRPHSYNTSGNVQPAYYSGSLSVHDNVTGLFNYNTWYDIKVEIVGTNSIKYYRDGVNEASFANQQYQSNTYAGIVAHEGNNMQWDWFLVRKYAATEPTVASPTSEEKGPGPVAYWKFDEGYGTTAQDATTNNNDSTLVGGPAWQTESMCISGKCLYFDGSDDYVSVGTNQFGSTAGSLSLWFKPMTGISNATMIFGHQNSNNRLYIGSNVWPRMYLGVADTGGIDSGKDISYNVWQQIVLTYNSGTWVFYYNGRQVSSGSYTGSITFTSPEIGDDGGSSWTNNFKGFIDEVKVYPYARTAVQIRADYLAGQDGLENGAAASFSSTSSGGSLSDGLVGYWKMDENTGTTTADASGNVNTTTFYHEPTWSSGKFGTGLTFDGYDDVIKVASASGDELNPANAVSVSAWVYVNEAKSSAYILVKGWGDTYGLALNSSNAVWFQIVNTPSSDFQSVTSSSTLSIGRWYHVVGTYDQSNIKVYIDGELKGTTAYTKTIYQGAQAFAIGGIQHMESSYYGNGFDGVIDDVHVYNRALSAKEVRDLYAWAPGPVAYYNFDEKTGTTLYDKSGNGNDSTSFGGSPEWVNGKFGGALDFDGSNDYVVCSSISTPTNTAAHSFSAWIKADSFSGWKTIMEYGSSRSTNLISNFAFNNSNIGHSFYGNDIKGNTTLLVDTWYHVAYVYDGGSQSAHSKEHLYVNGIEETITSLNGGGDPAVTSGSCRLADNISGGAKFAGTIDDLKFYNYARTAKQIVEDMNAGHPVGGSPVASQLGYWKFDEGYGDTVYDSGFGGNNGTITGADWTNDGKIGKALSFDGDGDYVSTTSGTLDVDQGTVTMWYYNTGVQSDQDVLFGPKCSSCNYPLHLAEISSSNGFRVWNESAWIMSVNNLSSGWHHVALLWDESANNMKLYVDGGLVDSYASYDNSWTSTGGVYIGADSLGARSATGIIDEVKIYNYALTQDEVLKDMNQGSASSMGNLSTDSSGNPDNSVSRSYCVPGDTTTCNSPVAEWRFDEKTGSTAYDTSGNGNNGTINNAVWTTGKLGSALNFDGDNDYIDIPGTFQPNPYITIEYWVQLDDTLPGSCSPESWETAVSKSSSFYDEFLCSNGAFYFRPTVSGTRVDDTYFTQTWTAGRWYHIAEVFDGAYTKIYVDGTEKVSKSHSGSLSTNSNVLKIGYWSSGTQDLDGKIDQVRIYDYARTPAQIAWDFNRGAPIGWWKMDECEGSTVYDWAETGDGYRGNDGTITIGGSGTQTAVGTCETSGTAWYNGATGHNNSSLNFDGTDDYVQVSSDGSNLYNSQEYSIAAWVNLDSVSVDNVIFSYDYTSHASPYYSAHLRFSNQRLYLLWNNGSSYQEIHYDKGDLSTGVWYHVVGTFKSGAQKLYIDGKVVASGTAADTITYYSQEVWLGRGNFGGWFKGQMDDVRIYNYTLTPEQVQQVYNNGAVSF